MFKDFATGIWSYNIRLLKEEQSDQGFHCLLFNLHIFEKFLCCKANLLEFKGDYSNILSVQNLGLLR